MKLGRVIWLKVNISYDFIAFLRITWFKFSKFSPNTLELKRIICPMINISCDFIVFLEI